MSTGCEPELSDQELMARTVKGDSTAYGCLYDRYVDGIYRYVYFRVTDREEAEDLTEPDNPGNTNGEPGDQPSESPSPPVQPPVESTELPVQPAPPDTQPTEPPVQPPTPPGGRP